MKTKNKTKWQTLKLHEVLTPAYLLHGKNGNYHTKNNSILLIIDNPYHFIYAYDTDNLIAYADKDGYKIITKYVDLDTHYLQMALRESLDGEGIPYGFSKK